MTETTAGRRRAAPERMLRGVGQFLDDIQLPTEHMETPSPFTFNGVKGVGEAGTVGAYAAVLNAVADALWPWGIAVAGLPVSPQRL